MEKVKAKALFIIGLSLLTGSPLIVISVVFVFPTLPTHIGVAAMAAISAIGFIIFMLALAKRRIENGTVRTHSIADALTTAQTIAILSMIILIVALVLVCFGSTSYQWLCPIAFIGMIISAIVAAVSAAKRRKAASKKSVKREEKRARTAADKTGKNNGFQDIECTVCRKNFPDGNMILVDDGFICENCFRKLYLNGDAIPEPDTSRKNIK